MMTNVVGAACPQRKVDKEGQDSGSGLSPSPNDATEGLAALEEFLAVDRLPKVIVMTGNSDRTNALQAVQLGAYDYIHKPIQLDVLKVILQRAAYLHCVGQEHWEIEEKRGAGEFEDILGVSSAMQRVFTMIRRVAASDVPVLITGESGFFFSSRRRHTRFDCDWSSDVCSSD